MMRRHLSLIVDPVACDGYGTCLELFPEHLTADPWGYPIVGDGEVPAELVQHARRAVASCPRQALTLVEVAPPPPA